MTMTIADIERAAGQVRSEMRVAAIKETAMPALANMNARLRELDEGIQRFAFKLPGEQRRNPHFQRLLRDLRRLHEDLLHFFNAHGSLQGPSTEESEFVLKPLNNLSAMLIGKFP